MKLSFKIFLNIISITLIISSIDILSSHRGDAGSGNDAFLAHKKERTSVPKPVPSATTESPHSASKLESATTGVLPTAHQTAPSRSSSAEDLADGCLTPPPADASTTKAPETIRVAPVLPAQTLGTPYQPVIIDPATQTGTFTETAMLGLAGDGKGHLESPFDYLSRLVKTGKARAALTGDLKIEDRIRQAGADTTTAMDESVSQQSAKLGDFLLGQERSIGDQNLQRSAAFSKFFTEQQKGPFSEQLTRVDFSMAVVDTLAPHTLSDAAITARLAILHGMQQAREADLKKNRKHFKSVTTAVLANLKRIEDDSNAEIIAQTEALYAQRVRTRNAAAHSDKLKPLSPRKDYTREDFDQLST